MSATLAETAPPLEISAWKPEPLSPLRPDEIKVLQDLEADFDPADTDTGADLDPRDFSGTGPEATALRMPRYAKRISSIALLTAASLLPSVTHAPDAAAAGGEIGIGHMLACMPNVIGDRVGDKEGIKSGCQDVATAVESLAAQRPDLIGAVEAQWVACRSLDSFLRRKSCQAGAAADGARAAWEVLQSGGTVNAEAAVAASAAADVTEQQQIHVESSEQAVDTGPDPEPDPQPGPEPATDGPFPEPEPVDELVLWMQQNPEKTAGIIAAGTALAIPFTRQHVIAPTVGFVGRAIKALAAPFTAAAARLAR